LPNTCAGFARGFGTFVESKSPKLNEYVGQADATLRSALAWIRAQRDGVPWFVFVHTYQVHYPYAPPPGYLDKVLTEKVTPAALLTTALYDAEIRYTDDLLAAFLADVEALPGGRETLVVVFSDHGEQFGEHGLYQHGNSLYDVLLHVPLILRAPGLVPAGRRVPAVVGLIDVAPTMLELLGLPLPHWTQGRSLVPLLENGHQLPEGHLFANLPLLNFISVRSATRKWIIDDATGRPSTFDFIADPYETKNQPGTTPAEVADLLHAYRTACRMLPAPPAPVADEEMDPAVREKSRALGYLD
jgi:arylsulfatase A-like enzyme